MSSEANADASVFSQRVQAQGKGKIESLCLCFACMHGDIGALGLAFVLAQLVKSRLDIEYVTETILIHAKALD